MTTKEAGRILGHTPTYICQLIYDGKLRAAKITTKIHKVFGRSRFLRDAEVWDIDPDSVRKYQDNRHNLSPRAHPYREGCMCASCHHRPMVQHPEDCMCASCDKRRNSEGLEHLINFRVTEEMRSGIFDAARELGISRNEFLRTCVECYLDELNGRAAS